MWSAGKLVVLAGALAATYVLFAAASMRVALRAREVQVPDLTNRTANDASAIATSIGLALRVDDSRRADAKIAAGRVLAQDPAAGSTARRQRTIRSG
jgi:beta-lactam-binding protein with PASTA domain